MEEDDEVDSVIEEFFNILELAKSDGVTKKTERPCTLVGCLER